MVVTDNGCLRKNAIEVINGTAFVHGGLPPKVTEVGLAGINGDLQNELVEYVKSISDVDGC